jgi:hypothetical protein
LREEGRRRKEELEGLRGQEYEWRTVDTEIYAFER